MGILQGFARAMQEGWSMQLMQTSHDLGACRKQRLKGWHEDLIWQARQEARGDAGAYMLMELQSAWLKS